MAIPKIAFINELGWLGANGGHSGTAAATATVSIPQGFEVRIPVRAVYPANQSAGPEIRAYRGIAASGGTVTYETEYAVVGAFAGANSGAQDLRDIVVLDTGYWVVAGYSGGPNTASFYVGTCEVITAYE